MYYRLKCYPHGNSKDDIAVLIVTQLLADEGVYVCVHTQTVWVCVDSCIHASVCVFVCICLCVYILRAYLCNTHASCVLVCASVNVLNFSTYALLSFSETLEQYIANM